MESVRSFPLYDQLLSQIPAGIRTPPEWKQLTGTIHNLPLVHNECIYAMIMHHYLLNKGSLHSLPPYMGKVFEGGKGMHYNAINFPLPLQHVIAEYIKKYT